MKWQLSILVVFVFSFHSQAEQFLERASFLPPNDLHLEDDLHTKDANMTEAEFNQIVDQVGAFYGPVVAHHGAQLTMLKNWQATMVNAYANQEGNNWVVAMFGGLARRPEITPDGFALVVCHELGHHLAGYPFYDDVSWASSEGQSDYFATQSCARNVWGNETQKNAGFRKSASLETKMICNATWSEVESQNLCYRIVEAAKSLATLMGSLEGKIPTLGNSDPSMVNVTSPMHPNAQCRLDTSVNGALCDSVFDKMTIPGRGHGEGQLSVAAEKESENNSCMRSNGYGSAKRPRCWFAPVQRLNAQKTKMEFVEVTGNGNGIPEPGEAYSFRAPVANSFSTAVGGASGQLRSSDKNVSLPNVVFYPRFTPGSEQESDRAFMVTIGEDFACGKRVPLSLHLRSSYGEDLNKISYKTGLPEEFEFLQSEGPLEIPAPADPDQPFGIIQANLASQVKRGAFDIEVGVNITGLPKEVVALIIVSPSGEQQVLNAFGDQGPLNQTYKVAIEDEKGAGEWTLVALNVSPLVGQMEWDLRLFGGVCQAP